MHAIAIVSAVASRETAWSLRRMRHWLCALGAIAIGLFSNPVWAVPQVAFSPMTHDFGIQALDTRSAPFNGYVTNTGTGRMTLESFNVYDCCITGSGPGGWAIAGACRPGLQLDSGESCSFAITFQPRTVGSHFGKYLIYVPEASFFAAGDAAFQGVGVTPEPYAFMQTGSPPGSGFASVIGFARTDIGPPGRTTLLTVVNLGLADLHPASWEIVGLNASDFTLGDGCRPGIAIATLGTCQIEVRFNPTAIGSRTAFLNLRSDGLAPAISATLVGTTTGPFIRSYAEFGSPRYGSTVYSRTTLSNDSQLAFTVKSVRLDGPNRFGIVSDGCNGVTLLPGANCTIEYSYTRAETDAGNLQVGATATIATTMGEISEWVVAFVGIREPEEALVRIIEYFNASTGHYFIASTNQLAEVRDLDTGVHAGWTRTGKSFYAYAMSRSERLPVCRFYIPPGYGDSHFYSASPSECADTQARFPQLIYESVDLFAFKLPDITTGACPVNSVPVYRVWNNRTDSNHRYTPDTAVVDQMKAQDWIAEGYGPGPYFPVMCGPPSLQAGTAVR